MGLVSQTTGAPSFGSFETKRLPRYREKSTSADSSRTEVTNAPKFSMTSSAIRSNHFDSGSLPEYASRTSAMQGAIAVRHISASSSPIRSLRSFSMSRMRRSPRSVLWDTSSDNV